MIFIRPTYLGVEGTRIIIGGGVDHNGAKRWVYRRLISLVLALSFFFCNYFNIKYRSI